MEKEYLLNKCSKDKYRQCEMALLLHNSALVEQKKSSASNTIVRFLDHPSLDLFAAQALNKMPQFAITQDYYLLCNFDAVFRMRCKDVTEADFDDLLIETVTSRWEQAENIECPFRK